MARANAPVPFERITASIYLVRGHKVMLDVDLAELYGVKTKALNQAVSRNIERFPDDFAFRLTRAEFDDLRSHFVTSSWGGLRYPPRVFTEHVSGFGVAVHLKCAVLRGSVPPW